MTTNRDLVALKKLEHEFNSLAGKSEHILSALKKKYRGTEVFNPQILQKKILIKKLTRIIHQLNKDWAMIELQETTQHSAETKSAEITRENEKKILDLKSKLLAVMQNLAVIANSLEDLTIDNEEEFLKNIAQFNTSKDVYSKEISILVKEFSHLKTLHKKIDNLNYTINLSNTMGIVAAVLKGLYITGLAWYSGPGGVGVAAESAGRIFYPITATFTAAAKLFALLIRTAQFFAASEQLSKQDAEDSREENLADAKALMRNSILFRILIFSLHALSVAAFAGLLATPVGWAAIGIATALEWVDDNLMPYRKANEELQSYKNKNPSPKLNSPEADNIKELEAEVAKKRSEAMWNFTAVVGAILIACAPIPIAGPLLAIIGTITIFAAPVRNGVLATQSYLQKKEDVERENEQILPPKINEQSKELKHQAQLSPKPLSTSHQAQMSPLLKVKADTKAPAFNNTGNSHKAKGFFSSSNDSQVKADRKSTTAQILTFHKKHRNLPESKHSVNKHFPLGSKAAHPTVPTMKKGTGKV